MSFLDELKDKAGELGEKAKGGLEAAKEKAADLVDDVKERLDRDDAPSEPVDDQAAGATDTASETAAPATDTLPEPAVPATDTLQEPAVPAAGPATDQPESGIDSVGDVGQAQDRYDAVLENAQEKAEAAKADPGTV
jgi:hypothetical protein